MIRNYFKIAWRNLLKNKLFSFINIGGLAMGLACCMAIGLFIFDELQYDKFHTKGANIYRVVEKQFVSGEESDVACTPGPLAPALAANFGEIKQTCRIRRLGNRIYKIGDNVVESNETYITDNSFFHLFDFKLLIGDKNSVLQSPDDLIITESVAKKFFGDNWKSMPNLIGQAITFNDKRVLKLVGIAENSPLNSSIQFETLLSVKEQEVQPDRFRWDNNDYHTYLELDNKSNAAIFESKIKNYYKEFVTSKQPQFLSQTQFSLQPFHDIYLKSDFDFQTDWNRTSNILYIKIFSIVALILLLIAMFNFFNLTTAQAIKRASEVGVRKAIGAKRNQLIFQFLTETFLMTFCSVFFALILLNFLLPLLNSIASKSISIPYSNPLFLIIIIGFTFLIGLLSGIFPALYLSGFQPIKVLKGRFVPQSKLSLRRSLIVIQFASSVVLIIGTMVTYQQMNFIQNKNLGFDKSQLLSLRLRFNAGAKADLLKTDLQNEKSIEQVALSSNTLIDITNGTHSIKWEGQVEGESFLMGLGNVDDNYLKTTGMKLVAGRNFDSRISSDTASAFIINQSAAKRMGWSPTEAIGKKFTLWETQGQIIGVINDFHFQKLNVTIEPFLLRKWTKEGYNALMVKTQANQTKEAIAAIERIYKKYERQTVPAIEFVDQALDKQYLVEQRIGKIVLFFSILSILVSCLGLFGLATFIAEQRTKEIGIRKVLGASVLVITNLLSFDFIKLVCISILFASPIAYFGMNRWLQDFAYRINIEWWIFAVAGVGLLLITLLTVSYQAVKAALMNPVKSLKTE